MALMANKKIELAVIFLLGMCTGYLLHHISKMEECRSLGKSPQAQQYKIDEDIIKKGNEQIYRVRYGNPYYKYYSLHGEIEKFYNDKIIYAVLMANKYKVYDIAFDVYSVFVNRYYAYRQYIDKEMFQIGMDYLRYGADNGSQQCLLNLSELYDKGILVEKDSDLADSLYKEFEKEYIRVTHFK